MHTHNHTSIFICICSSSIVTCICSCSCAWSSTGIYILTYTFVFILLNIFRPSNESRLLLLALTHSEGFELLSWWTLSSIGISFVSDNVCCICCTFLTAAAVIANVAIAANVRGTTVLRYTRSTTEPGIIMILVLFVRQRSPHVKTSTAISSTYAPTAANIGIATTTMFKSVQTDAS